MITHQVIQKIHFATLILLVGTLALSACAGNSKGGEPKASEKAIDSADRSSEVFIVKEQEMRSETLVPGELVAFNQVDLYAKVNSFVKKLTIDVGSRVQAGALLATLEAPEVGAQYDAQTSNLKAAEAAWIASKATYDRLLKTSETPGTVSPNDLDIALARRDADNAKFEAAKAAQREVGNMRSYLEIRAPFAGVITTRNVSAGAYVGPSGRGSEQPMFVLQEDRKLRLIVGVPQQYVSYVKTGQPITFTVQSLPGEIFKASVVRKSSALDPSIRSERIEMDVDNTAGKLLPGMITEVHFAMEAPAGAIGVPPTALLRSTKGMFVIRVENGRIAWVPVQPGNATEDLLQVYGKINYGDTLVSQASEEVREGTKFADLR